MALTERIRVLFEVDDKGSFGKLKRDIASADTAAGKAKAGFSGLGDSLKANAAGAAVAAGSALVAFGVKAVNAFTDSALAASKFADATGLAVEDASRWIEVASDVGVEASTIQGAFLKMNKSIADGKSSWTEYGIEVVKTKDGLTDSNATMVQALSKIGAIPDATDRAKAAQEVFGKSYAEVAELMEMDAASLQAALASVSDEQVIDEDEVRKAKAFRSAMDSLQDSFTRLQMAIGEELTPAITEAAEGIQSIIDSPLIGWLGKASRAIDKVTIDIGDLATGFRVAGDAIDIVFGNDVPGALGQWEKKTDDVTTSTVDFYGELQELNEEAEITEGKFGDVKDAAEELGTAYDKLKGKFDEKQAWRNAQDAIGELMTTMADSESSWADLEVAADGAALAVADYIMQTDLIKPETKTQLITELDQGNLDVVRAFLDAVQKGFTVPLIPEIRNSAGTVKALGSYGRVLPGGTNVRGATGGIVTQPTLAVIGEAGPEAVVPLNKTPGSSPLPSGMGGATYVFNVLGSVDRESAQKIAQAVQRLERERR